MQNILLDIKEYTFVHMKSKPIPYSEAKLISKYVIFMNAVKEPVLWISIKMSTLLMCQIHSAVTH